MSCTFIDFDRSLASSNASTADENGSDAVINGGPGLMLVVEKFPGANTLDVTNGIDKALAAMAPAMPGVQINNQIFRQASFIEIAIHNLSQSVLIGCILVVFVLLMFLFQWRAALVSAAESSSSPKAAPRAASNPSGTVS